MFAMLAQEELIGHSCNVIAYDDVSRLGLRTFFVENRHRAWFGKIEVKQLLQTLHRAVAIFRDHRMIVNVSKEESLQCRIVSRSLFAESSEPLRGATNIVR